MKKLIFTVIGCGCNIIKEDFDRLPDAILILSVAVEYLLK